MFARDLVVFLLAVYYVYAYDDDVPWQFPYHTEHENLVPVAEEWDFPDYDEIEDAQPMYDDIQDDTPDEYQYKPERYDIHALYSDII